MQASFEKFLTDYPASIQRIAKQLRSIILADLPEMMEIVDAPSKIVAYGTSPKYADLVCAIAPFQKHVNLMFSRGAGLPDPDEILKGTGKKARHIHIEELTGELEKSIRIYLRSAGNFKLPS